MSNSKIKLELAFFKAECENKKLPWQKGWVSQKIAHHARGTHSHVEFVFVYGDGEEICFSSSEQDGGSRFKHGSEIFKNPDRWDRFTITEDQDKIERIWSFCVEQKGKKYDWIGALRFKLSFLDEDPNLWYCSEVVQEGCYLYELLPKLYSIHPEDMFRIVRFLYKKG